MSTKPLKSLDLYTLESLVDQYTLADVLDALDALETICTEKADHIAHIWQDKPTAGAWSTMSARLQRAAAKARLLRV